MNLIDLIVILIVVIIAVLSAKKGFLASVLNIAAFIASGFISRMVAGPVSEYLYKTFLSERIISELYEIMPSGSLEAELFEVVDGVMSTLPEFFILTAKQFGLYPDLSSIQAGSRYTVEMIESTYVSSILCKVLTVVVLIVMFILLSFVFRAVISLVNRFVSREKHRVIRKTNMFFGAAFGVIKGTVPAGVICAVLNIAAPVIDNDILSEYVTGSYFCNLIADLLK